MASENLSIMKEKQQITEKKGTENKNIANKCKQAKDNWLNGKFTIIEEHRYSSYA